jgi:hypothetical protein
MGQRFVACDREQSFLMPPDVAAISAFESPRASRSSTPRSLAEEDPAKRVAKFARADRIESRVEFEAGPAANNPGLRAVLRRHAPSATRQRTLEANGIDCGAGPV